MATDLHGQHNHMLGTAKKIIKEQGKKGIFKGAAVRAAFLGFYTLALGLAEDSFKSILISGK